MDIRIDGRAALITGGSKGLGFAMAKAFAEAGGKVAIVARDRDGLARAEAALRKAAPGATIAAIAADISTAQGCSAAFDGAAHALGQVDILVNNAGTSQRGPFLEQSDAIWQADLDLKLFGAIRATRLCLPYLRVAQGAIVNVIAIGGKAPGARSLPSTVSRAAGLALTKALSKEFAADHVRVNAVCIGTVRSGQHDPEWRQHYPHLSSDEFYAELARRRAIPMGRVGDPEEAADLIAYLLSDRARYITGTAVNLDGGASPVF